MVISGRDALGEATGVPVSIGQKTAARAHDADEVVA